MLKIIQVIEQTENIRKTKKSKKAKEKLPIAEEITERYLKDFTQAKEMASEQADEDDLSPNEDSDSDDEDDNDSEDENLKFMTINEEVNTHFLIL